tara:strand:+ start:91 stop:540 length:450 start_codon:yes stop_codon:yes gene_type:complete
MNIELVALHKHWCTADAVKQFVSAELPEKASDKELSAEFQDFGKLASSFMRLSVWYSLLYVVIEGFKELSLDDEKVNELLANESNVDCLRLFRNATFHYQKNPLTEKAQKFILAKDSETWARELNKAFEQFFLNNLPIKETLNAIKQST